MKNELGIEIKCENCENKNSCDSAEMGCAFTPNRETLEARICELRDELQAEKFNYESWEEMKEEVESRDKRIAELEKRLEGHRRDRENLLEIICKIAPNKMLNRAACQWCQDWLVSLVANACGSEVRK